jgi:hypothetical protein
MLDDLKMIHDRDSDDALGVAEKQWQQLKYEFGIEIPKMDNITNIVVGGLGGSAWNKGSYRSHKQL